MNKFLTIAAALMLSANAAIAGTGIETPSLLGAVKAGKLPPLAQRLPQTPRVINLEKTGLEPGRHGGTIRMLIGKSKDIKLIPIYGYARLVGYDRDLKLVADILQSFEVQDGRIFTFHLRKGHKWSDGHPFTAEDFRYGWQDVLTDDKLGRGGLTQALLVDGKGPQFEVIDDQTVRYSWPKPNPLFLPALAAPVPIYLAVPSHYLRQFHKKYQSAKALAAILKKYKVKKWYKLHQRMAREKKATNPDLPTLSPWVPTTRPPSDYFVFRRNPFFHRVDEAGRQLPYVDKITVSVTSGALIPAKAGAGDADLQARNLNFSDYTHLKSGEERSGFSVRLWKSGKGSAVTLLPNLNAKDPLWRKTMRDVRFRRALSLAINRHEINQIMFFGLAKESADTVLEQSPLFKKQYQQAWIRHDLKAANRLLDEMGLTKPDNNGLRQLGDGRPVEIIVETAGESTLQSDVLELIKDQWRQIGIRLIIKNSQRDVLRSRAISGQAIMTVWNGLDNALLSPLMDPGELVPTSQSALQWPQWGAWYQSKGKKGEKPQDPVVLQMLANAAAWKNATTIEQKTAPWHAILKDYTDQVYSIGTVNASLQPIVVSKRLHNVPQKAIYAYAPTSFFGVYLPDTFWFSPKDKGGN